MDAGSAWRWARARAIRRACRQPSAAPCARVPRRRVVWRSAGPRLDPWKEKSRPAGRAGLLILCHVAACAARSPGDLPGAGGPASALAAGEAGVADLAVVVVLQLFLMLLQLVGQLGDHGVDRVVERIALFLVVEPGHAVGVKPRARAVQGATRLVLVLVDGQDHVEGFDVVEKAFEAADLLFHALTQGGGDMDVLAADLDLH